MEASKEKTPSFGNSLEKKNKPKRRPPSLLLHLLKCKLRKTWVLAMAPNDQL